MQVLDGHKARHHDDSDERSCSRGVAGQVVLDMLFHRTLCSEPALPEITQGLQFVKIEPTLREQGHVNIAAWKSGIYCWSLTNFQFSVLGACFFCSDQLPSPSLLLCGGLIR